MTQTEGTLRPSPSMVVPVAYNSLMGQILEQDTHVAHFFRDESEIDRLFRKPAADRPSVNYRRYL
jgi:hypothetical protein